MPIDVTTPQSPGWWLLRLQHKLDDRRKRVDPLYARYEGNAETPAELSSAPEAARLLFAYGFGSVVSILAGGIITDRFGRRRTLLVGLFGSRALSDASLRG